MATHAYIINLNPAVDPVQTTVSSLITKISNWYRFLGVDDKNLTVKRFRHSAIVTGVLHCSPSPRVSIDFSDPARVKVEPRNVNIEPIFDQN